MKKLRVMSVVGARPNFMKIAPFIHQLARHPDRFQHRLVHTGQHYDPAMSALFFDELAIPKPDIDLGIGSGEQEDQVNRTMTAFDPVLKREKPDWVVVVGDVNATRACSVAAANRKVKVAHIEAGLRSFDKTMPEEANRIAADRVSELLFTPDETADRNLRNEGAPQEKIKRVGNIMIDTLEDNRRETEKLDPVAIVVRNPAKSASAAKKGFSASGYALLTLHRPSNVDEKAVLEPLVKYLADELSASVPLVWSLHPRTRKQLEAFGLWKKVLASPGIFPVEPLGYREMLRLNMSAQIMLTDSGGLQEECCVLGTPCVVLRENTERPVTLRKNGGVCELAGHDIEKIRRLSAEMRTMPKKPFRPPLWDGRTAERIVQVFLSV